MDLIGDIINLTKEVIERSQNDKRCPAPFKKIRLTADSVLVFAEALQSLPAQPFLRRQDLTQSLELLHYTASEAADHMKKIINCSGLVWGANGSRLTIVMDEKCNEFESAFIAAHCVCELYDASTQTEETVEVPFGPGSLKRIDTTNGLEIVLSFLTVEKLLQLRVVSKDWQDFIESNMGRILQNKTLTKSRIDAMVLQKCGTVLGFFTRFGREEAVRNLCKCGAKLNLSSRLAPTPLVMAVLHNHVEIARALIQAGADPNERCQSNSAFPLYVASCQGKKEIVQILVENKANLESTIPSGATPLIGAISHCQVDTAKILLSLGANPNAALTRGEARHSAATLTMWGQMTELIPDLIAHGLDVHARIQIRNHVFPLLYFAVERDVRAVDFLLEKGADPNSATSDGFSVLCKAVDMGNADCVRVLLERGADANSRTADGAFCLYKACENGKTEIVKLLVKHGGDVTMKYKGFTCLDKAVSAMHHDVVRFLTSLRNPGISLNKDSQIDCDAWM